jgi:hypothetical protein
LTAKGGNEKLTASVKRLGMVAVFEEPLDVKDVLVAANRILDDTRLPRFPPVVTCALPKSVGLKSRQDQPKGPSGVPSWKRKLACGEHFGTVLL